MDKRIGISTRLDRPACGTGPARNYARAGGIRAAAALLCAILLAGCGSDDTAPRSRAGGPESAGDTGDGVAEDSYPLFEDGLRRFRDGDYAGAIIQFRNVLQAHPGNPAARAEIGRALLAYGDPAAAEHELGEAIRAGAHPDTVSVPLGTALLQQGKFSELERLARTPARRRPEVEAALQVLLADAYVRQGDGQKATKVLERARELDPANPDPLLRLAELAFESGDGEAAGELVAIAEKTGPRSAEVFAFKGKLAFREGRYDLALENYKRAKHLDPDLLGARTGYARTLMLLGQVDQAITEIELVYDAKLPDPDLAYVYALALLQVGRAPEARVVIETTTSLLAGLDVATKIQNPSLLMVSALVGYLSGDLEVALRDASALVQILPRHLEARYLLAQVQLAVGNTSGVVTTLAPVLSSIKKYGPMLIIYGEALRDLGRFRDAMPVLEDAVAAMPKSVQARVALARTQIALAKIDDAISTLDATGDSTRDLTIDSGGSLVEALVHGGELDRAREVARALIEKFPEDPVAATMLGSLELEKGDFVNGRRHLERALELKTDFIPAAVRLADLERLEGRLSEASNHYLKILDADRTNTGALAGLARVAEENGDLALAFQWLEKLRAIDPSAEAPILHLIDLYMRNDKPDQALAVAEDFARKFPEQFNAQFTHGRVLAMLERTDRARILFRRCTRLAGFEVKWLKMLAGYQMAVNDPAGAKLTLQNAAVAAPEDPEIAVQLIQINLVDRDFDVALASIDALGEKFPDSGLREFLRAEVLTRMNRPAEALAAYESAAMRKPDAHIIERIYAQQLRLGENDRAIATLERWLEAHPDDHRIRHALAATHLHLGNLDRAEPLLRALHDAVPENASVLNNLAWLLIEKGDPEGLDHAASAYARNPEDPAVIDTYAWGLINYGDPQEGLRLMREAIARAGETPGNQYHLAAALSRLGRDAEAAETLKRLLARDTDFPERKAALALRDRIGN